MEGIRNRPRSQVLRAHKERSPSDGRRSRRMAAPLRRRRPVPARAEGGIVNMNSFRRVFRRARAEKSLDKELQFHLERQIADYVAAGIQPEEARRRARLEFGTLDRVKEEVSDTRWEDRIENVLRDFRYA